MFGEILLASNSPRRKQLLTEVGFDVEVVKGRDIEELYPTDIPIEDIPVYLSKLKALPYKEMALERKRPLVTADTIVILEGEPLGKPADELEAVELLRKLSGKEHEVVSGVTLFSVKGEEITFKEITSVRFSNLPDEIIEYYVDEKKPLDKAGAYGIQELIGLLGVEKIDGDFYNVMGFPVNRFMKTYLSLCTPLPFKKT